MKIAVCEDNPLQRDMLCDLLRAQAAHLALDVSVHAYASGEELLADVLAGQEVDCLIADIYMGGCNGMLTAMKVREKLPGVQLAFFTASREYALDAFSLNALHYLVKPVTAADVRELLERYQERRGQSTADLLRIHTSHEEMSFPLRQVCKVVSAQKKCDVYLAGQEQPVRVNLSFQQMATQMNQPCFIQITRGVMVHCDFIRQMTAEACVMQDGTSLLMSRGRREEIRRAYRRYCRRENQP